MEKCDKCLEENIVKWDVPESPHDFMYDFMHICSRCGHSVWPDEKRPDAEDQSPAPGDDATPR